jgi:hypothetical protein
VKVEEVVSSHLHALGECHTACGSWLGVCVHSTVGCPACWIVAGCTLVGLRTPVFLNCRGYESTYGKGTKPSTRRCKQPTSSLRMDGVIESMPSVSKTLRAHATLAQPRRWRY